MCSLTAVLRAQPGKLTETDVSLKTLHRRYPAYASHQPLGPPALCFPITKKIRKSPKVGTPKRDHLAVTGESGSTQVWSDNPRKGFAFPWSQIHRDSEKVPIPDTTGKGTARTFPSNRSKERREVSLYSQKPIFLGTEDSKGLQMKPPCSGHISCVVKSAPLVWKE